MYNNTPAHGAVAAAGTLPFTGLSLTLTLVSAIALMVTGSGLYWLAGRRSGVEAA